EPGLHFGAAAIHRHVEYGRVFVHATTDAMTDVVFENAVVALRVHILGNSLADLVEVRCAGQAGDTTPHRLLGDRAQLFHTRSVLGVGLVRYHHGDCRVAVPPADHRAHIERNDVTWLEGAVV